MKTLLFILLTVSSACYGQTTTTKTVLRGMTAPSLTTVWRVYLPPDTLYYRVLNGVSLPDDDNNILVSKTGVRFVKLIPSLPSPIVDAGFTMPQLLKIAQLIEDNRKSIGAKQIADSLLANRPILFLKEGYFEGDGTTEKPITPLRLKSDSTNLKTKAQ